MTRSKEALARAIPTGEDTQVARELEELNRFTKTPLTEEQVYLFSVRLCDNQIDRDEERFSRAALEQLAPLFVGKSGLFDHNWSAKEQAARIYRTEVLSEPGVEEQSGEGKCFLKGYAYMLRNETNQSLIDEIEAGIKKEVSVSCSVARVLCSICGNDLADHTACGHVKGRLYENKRCVGLLTDPADAYEWSFVAVPAQRSAGVMKALSDWAARQKGAASVQTDGSALEETLARIEGEAALGRKYLDQLRRETLRLGLLSQEGMRADTLAAICEKMSEEELLAMQRAYTETLKGRYPLTQLPYREEERKDVRADRAFQI